MGDKALGEMEKFYNPHSLDYLDPGDFEYIGPSPDFVIRSRYIRDKELKPGDYMMAGSGSYPVHFDGEYVTRSKPYAWKDGTLNEQ